MNKFNPRAMFVVAKKEFLDHIRNKWILFLTIIFVLLIILFSYAAGSFSFSEDTFANMQITVFGLMGTTSWLILLIAIMLGFSTISGEAESGALNIVLSYPVRRVEVLLGKLLGLGSVLIVSIFIGFGIGGVIIALTVGPESWIGYIAFIFLSIFLGFIYLSLSICISSFCKKRITSIAGGILIFFWSWIYEPIIVIILFVTGGSEDFLSGNTLELYINSKVFNPSALYDTTVRRAFGIDVVDTIGGSAPYPDFLSTINLIIFHIIWVIVPMVLAYYFFKKRDI